MPLKPPIGPIYPGTRILCRITRGRILLVEAQRHQDGGATCETCPYRRPCGELQSELRPKEGR
jgi:hypothetical protein